MAASQVMKLPHIVVEDAAILLAGSSANWALYGILVLQVYLYAVAFPKDRRLLKGVVYVDLALETAQTALITHDAFRFFAIGFLNPAGLNQVNTGWFSIPILTGLIASLTQGFYCYRIARITRSKSAVCIIILFSLIQLAGAISIGIRTKNAKIYSNLFLDRNSFVATGIWDAGSAVCDLTIAAIMIHHLRNQDTGFENTRKIISRIIRLTIETGSATATLALIVMVLAFLPGHPAYYQAFALILGKAYSISMMVVLNSRVKVVPNHDTVSWNETLAAPEVSVPRSEFSFIRHREQFSDMTVNAITDVTIVTTDTAHLEDRWMSPLEN